MTRTRLSALLACALPLGACAYVGMAPAIVDAAKNNRNNRPIGDNFEAAAAEACSARAARYGRLTLGDVRRVSDSMVRVVGTVQQATRERAFTCDFRSSGRIADFRI